jgi:manganese efflux pump family protein
MTFPAILIIAVALSVDAFAIALAMGISLPTLGWQRTARLSSYFAFFQTAMNIIGWGAGFAIRPVMAAVSHWLAFGLLTLAGGQMIWQAVRPNRPARGGIDPSRGRGLTILAVAISLDALAVGVSFSMLQISIWLPAFTIGVVTFLLTAVGLHLGRAVGIASHLGDRAEIIGGLVLVAIGFKILHEHGVF